MKKHSKLQDWFDSHEEKLHEDLFSFLRFPSISTDPEYKSSVHACAEWLLAWIEKIGMKGELISTPVHPVIYAEHMEAGEDAPTLLIYGHYDVQPVDPLNEWNSDPFEPNVKDGKVYARGALDNKGQIFYSLCAIKALLEVDGSLGVNLKLCIEGEEESASRGLEAVLPKIGKKWKADYVLVPDFDLAGPNQPAITLGIRGIMAMEFVLIGSRIDMHSGQHGGIAYNPNRALVEVLAKLINEKGKVQVPGFYDTVKELTQEEKKLLDLRFDSKEYSDEFGVDLFGGEEEYSPLESNWLRPTMEINGIEGGYTKEGFKTVIPTTAKAKLSCRLVPDQDPEKIFDSVKQFISKHIPKGMKVEFENHGGGFPVWGDVNSMLAKAASKAYSEIFDRPCSNVISGGSVPIISGLVKASGGEVVFMGYGLSSDNMHAPNEHFGLDRFEKGFLTVARIVELLN